MWNRKKSLLASIGMTVLLLFMIITAVFILPWLLEFYEKMTGVDSSDLMIPLYISALPGLVCVVCLLFLLLNIRKSEIFVEKNIILLRILSWCCFVVGVDYLCFSLNRVSMLLLSFAAFFFGMILRVIKNVFDKAIEIREENDYTI